jgi:hypothetical protein
MERSICFSFLRICLTARYRSLARHANFVGQRRRRDVRNQVPGILVLLIVLSTTDLRLLRNRNKQELPDCRRSPAGLILRPVGFDFLDVLITKAIARNRITGNPEVCADRYKPCIYKGLHG